MDQEREDYDDPPDPLPSGRRTAALVVGLIAFIAVWEVVSLLAMMLYDGGPLGRHKLNWWVVLFAAGPAAVVLMLLLLNRRSGGEPLGSRRDHR